MPGVPPPVDNTAPVCVKEEVKQEVKKETAESYVPAVLQPDLYDFLEQATSNMRGIRVICTIDAILRLWQWESKEDLLKARAAIDYLLKKENS